MASAQERATQATNEYIRDFCERHESCQATRDEAHQNVARLEKMADEVRVLTDRWLREDDREMTSEEVFNALIKYGDEDQLELVSRLYAALVEKAKEADEYRFDAGDAE